jgi:hypothetical protein
LEVGEGVSSGQIKLSDQFWTLRPVQMKSGRTLIVKILENFITFLTRGRTLNYDLKRRNYDRLNLNNIIRYDFLVLI